MIFQHKLFAVGMMLLPLLVDAQCSNQIFPNNNLQRTASTDYTYFIIQLPKDNLTDATGGKKLLDIPNGDFSPCSLQAGYHPIWCSIGYMNDIRQIGLSINWLLQSSCYIPYVDCTGNGRDPCNYPIFNALGGDNGQINSGLLPATVSTLLGTPVELGYYDPSNAVVTEDSPGRYHATVQNAYLGVTNPASGPSDVAKLMNTRSQDLAVLPLVQAPSYNKMTFRRIINQVNWTPLGLPGKQCTRNNYYFNSTDNMNLERTGTATLYGFSLSPFDGGFFSPINDGIASPDGTVFSNLGALRMTCGQWVGQEFGEDCVTAVKNNDPSSWLDGN